MPFKCAQNPYFSTEYPGRKMLQLPTALVEVPRLSERGCYVKIRTLWGILALTDNWIYEKE